MTMATTGGRGIFQRIRLPGTVNFIALLALFAMMVILQQLFGKLTEEPTAQAPESPAVEKEAWTAPKVVQHAPAPAPTANRIATEGLAEVLLPSTTAPTPPTEPKALPGPAHEPAKPAEKKTVAVAPKMNPTPEKPRIDRARSARKRRAIARRQQQLAERRRVLEREREVSVEELDNEAARQHYQRENARLSQQGGARALPATATADAPTFIPFERR